MTLITHNNRRSVEVGFSTESGKFAAIRVCEYGPKGGFLGSDSADLTEEEVYQVIAELTAMLAARHHQFKGYYEALRRNATPYQPESVSEKQALNQALGEHYLKRAEDYLPEKPEEA